MERENNITPEGAEFKKNSISLEEDLEEVSTWRGELNNLDDTMAKWETAGNYFAEKRKIEQKVKDAESELFEITPDWIKDKFDRNQEKVVAYLLYQRRLKDSLFNNGSENIGWALHRLVGPQGEQFDMKSLHYSVPAIKPQESEIVEGIKKWGEWQEKATSLCYRWDKLGHGTTPYEEMVKKREELVGELIRITNEIKDVLYLPEIDKDMV